MVGVAGVGATSEAGQEDRDGSKGLGKAGAGAGAAA